MSDQTRAQEPNPPPNFADAAEMLWTVVANVSGGNWAEQSPEWQEAAARWRDYYLACIAASGPRPTTAPVSGAPIPQDEEYTAQEMACKGCFGPCGFCHEVGAPTPPTTGEHDDCVRELQRRHDLALEILAAWQESENEDDIVKRARTRTTLRDRLRGAPTPPEPETAGKARCETHGHIYGVDAVCIFCGAAPVTPPPPIDIERLVSDIFEQVAAERDTTPPRITIDHAHGLICDQCGRLVPSSECRVYTGSGRTYCEPCYDTLCAVTPPPPVEPTTYTSGSNPAEFQPWWDAFGRPLVARVNVEQLALAAFGAGYDRGRQLERGMNAPVEPCPWRRENNSWKWSSGCGFLFDAAFSCEPPEDEMHWCPYCGKPLVILSTEPQEPPR